MTAFTESRRARTAEPDLPATVVALPFEGTDAALVAALLQGHPGAPAVLCERHAAHVRRVLIGVLGADAEVPDLLQETFSRALKKIGSLRDPARLRSWLTTIAIFAARSYLRKRRRERWLEFRAPESLSHVPAPERDDMLRALMTRTYMVLDRLPADERIVFAMRFVGDMELTEIADACDSSLATIKRRLARARERFMALARNDAVLGDWLRERGAT